MKQIFVVRHAKSSWADFGQADFDRPLNDRGKSDAPMMAKRLKDKNMLIDAFVSSPAKRAKQTCKAFCEAYHVKKEAIIFQEALYNAPAMQYYKTLEQLDASIESVAIFGHNPGITDFVNSLCKDEKTDNMPTCAVFAVSANINNWSEFADAEKKFMLMDYPKNT